MDDLENKLGAILNDPQMMQQIMQMAQSFNQPGPSQEHSQPGFPEPDLSMLQKLSGFAQKSNIDANQQGLLNALGPYLNHQRLSRLERAMRAAKMAGMATAFLGTGR